MKDTLVDTIRPSRRLFGIIRHAYYHARDSDDLIVRHNFPDVARNVAVNEEEITPSATLFFFVYKGYRLAEVNCQPTQHILPLETMSPILDLSCAVISSQRTDTKKPTLEDSNLPCPASIQFVRLPCLF